MSVALSAHLRSVERCKHSRSAVRHYSVNAVVCEGACVPSRRPRSPTRERLAALATPKGCAAILAQEAPPPPGQGPSLGHCCRALRIGQQRPSPWRPGTGWERVWVHDAACGTAFCEAMAGIVRPPPCDEIDDAARAQNSTKSGRRCSRTPPPCASAPASPMRLSKRQSTAATSPHGLRRPVRVFDLLAGRYFICFWLVAPMPGQGPMCGAKGRVYHQDVWDPHASLASIRIVAGACLSARPLSTHIYIYI